MTPWIQITGWAPARSARTPSRSSREASGSTACTRPSNPTSAASRSVFPPAPAHASRTDSPARARHEGAEELAPLVLHLDDPVAVRGEAVDVGARRGDGEAGRGEATGTGRDPLDREPRGGLLARGAEEVHAQEDRAGQVERVGDRIGLVSRGSDERAGEPVGERGPIGESGGGRARRGQRALREARERLRVGAAGDIAQERREEEAGRRGGIGELRPQAAAPERHAEERLGERAAGGGWERVFRTQHAIEDSLCGGPGEDLRERPLERRGVAGERVPGDLAEPFLAGRSHALLAFRSGPDLRPQARWHVNHAPNCSPREARS